MFTPNKARRASPSKAVLAPNSVGSKQVNRRLLASQSARLAAQNQGLVAKQVLSPRGRGDSEDDSVDEGAHVRALLAKAKVARAGQKQAYLKRCVEDSKKQPAPKPDYFTTVQRGKITPDVRENIVAWLQRCGEWFQLLPETIETAVYLLDRLLSAAHIPTEKHVRIVAATCMLIAGKTCEAQGQGVMVGDLVRACGAAFSVNDVQRMERVILGKFGWSGVGKMVTPYVVSAALVDVAGCIPPSADDAAEVRRNTNTLISESLSAQWFLNFSVAEVACSAVLTTVEPYHSQQVGKLVAAELTSLAQVDPAAVDECTRKMRQSYSNNVLDIPML